MSSPPLALHGLDLFGEPVREAPKAPLAERFLVPPFSVLSAREGAWQERKAAWLSLGIKGEVGRGENLLKFSDAENQMQAGLDPYHKKAGAPVLDSAAGRAADLTFMLDSAAGRAGDLLHSGATVDARNGDEWEGGRSAWQNEGTSVFDPVLCEVAYRWFCPPGGHVLDPFAGGSVRGLIAAFLGRRYWGAELRPEQVAANEAQAAALIQAGQAKPEWRLGDARELLPEAPLSDFIFSCPPYGDLERYSDDPRDLSTMSYVDFVLALREIVAKAAARLRQDRFACFVVGEFRDPKTGIYRNFVGHTVDAFKRAGLGYYNEAILLTAIGSLPVRAGRQFAAGRKLGKTHQNVLVFVKGDGKKAAQACGEPFPLAALEAEAEAGGAGAP